MNYPTSISWGSWNRVSSTMEHDRMYSKARVFGTYSFMEKAKVEGLSATSLGYLMFPLASILGYVSIFVLNTPWMTIFVVYGLIPWLDGILGKDATNPTQEETQSTQDSWEFKVGLYLSIVIDWVSIFQGVSTVSKGEKEWWDVLPMLFLLVNVGATGFVVAHELFHRADKVDKFVGTLHMLKNLYLHLTIEHIHGHHKRVGTPEDGATAQKGISLYRFVPRAIYMIYCSAYNFNPWFVRASTLSYFLICLAVQLIWGWAGLGFFLAVALGSVFYLETTSYIEHYGLTRNKLPDGNYESVNRRCSWDSNNKLSNFLLFKLQRHSDHHQNSLKPYQNLCSNNEAPQLPHGYIVCILMAFFPSVWFQTMNPLLEEHHKREEGDVPTALQNAEQKAGEFVKRSLAVSGVFMVCEVVLKLVC